MSLFLFLTMGEEHSTKELCPEELQKDEDSLLYTKHIGSFLVHSKITQDMSSGSISSKRLIEQIKKHVSIAPVEKQISLRFDFKYDPEGEKEFIEAKQIFITQKIPRILKHIEETYKKYCLERLKIKN